MKRKCSETRREDLSRIRSSCIRGFRGVRSSEARSFGPTISRGTKVDEPKTSEYAFFKKFKKDADQSLHIQPPHNGDIQTEKFESKMTNTNKKSFINLRPSSLREHATPVKVYSFPSPVHSASENSGILDEDQDIFFKKRQKLRQWVADTSFPEVDELCFKGYDLVSILLSRLLPESIKENQHHGDLTFSQAEINANSKSLDFPAPTTLYDEARGSPFCKLLEPGSRIHLGDGSSACWFNKSRDLAISKGDILVSGFPTTCYEKNLQDKFKELDCDFDGGRIASLCPASDSAFGFPCKKYRSFASRHPIELGLFCDSHIPALGTDSITPPLLGWDFYDKKDEKGLSIASLNWDLNLLPMSSNSRERDDWRCPDKRFDMSWHYSSSFLSNYCPNNTSKNTDLDAETNSNLDGGRLVILCTENDSALGIPFKKYMPFASGHLEELDEIHDPNETSLERDLSIPLLDWNFDTKGEEDFSLTSLNGDLNSYPTSPISQGNDDEQILDSRLDTSWLCSSSILSNCDPNCFSPTHFSATYCYHDFERCPKDMTYLLTRLKQWPMTVSSMPYDLNPVEDCNIDMYRSSSIFFSNEMHHPGLEASLLTSGLDFDLGWKHFPVSDSSREHFLSTCHAFRSRKEALCFDLKKDE